jgi:hypothetical protein
MRALRRFAVELFLPFVVGFGASVATFPPDCESVSPPAVEVSNS